MNRKNIGQNIHTLRRQHGITQAVMAEKTGVSTDHISHVEIGSGTISLPLLIEICRLLQATPNDILAGEYELEPPTDTNPSQEAENSEMKISFDKVSPEDMRLLLHMYKYMTTRK